VGAHAEGATPPTATHIFFSVAPLNAKRSAIPPAPWQFLLDFPACPAGSAPCTSANGRTWHPLASSTGCARRGEAGPDPGPRYTLTWLRDPHWQSWLPPRLPGACRPRPAKASVEGLVADPVVADTLQEQVVPGGAGQRVRGRVQGRRGVGRCHCPPSLPSPRQGTPLCMCT
jgi:hypothetical protein